MSNPHGEFCTGDPSIIVAVMDEGVMYKHEDLAANMWVNQAELNGQKGVDETVTDMSMTSMAIILPKTKGI